GVFQRPPGQAEERYPDQGFLEKELNVGNAAVKDAQQDQDIHPGLVVGHHHVPVAPAQVKVAVHLNMGAGEPFLVQVIEVNPGTGDPVQPAVAGLLPARHGNQSLDQGQEQQGENTQQGKQDKQQTGQNTY